MPQEEGKEPRVSTGEKNSQCYIHDNVGDGQANDIRENVCQDLPLSRHSDDNDYCLFHLPDEKKDGYNEFTNKFGKFEEKFKERLKQIEEKIAAIEELPEDERDEARRKISYDFSYVWFPSYVELKDYKFQAVVYFSFATFSAGADFGSAAFSSDAYFISTTFSSYTSFSSATFSAGADFKSVTFSAFISFSSATFSSDADFLLASFSSNAGFLSATFSSDVNFRAATFFSDADFSLATFSAGAEFPSATFSSDALFDWVKFEETSQSSFSTTSFQGTAYFRRAVVKGYLYFEAGEGEFFDGEWLDEEKTKPKYVKRETSVFENNLNFAHVRAEKPERMTFNKTRLRPGWFVNTDSRKFIFTDIKWENHKARDAELEEELKSLENRKYGKPHNYQLLTIALRNLAANAEEFNRYEEASNFRKSAFECERLERIYKQKKWRRELKEEKGKSFSERWTRFKDARFDFVSFLYRWLSDYGESWSWAFLCLLIIWISFALFYTFLGTFGTEGRPMNFPDAVSYSFQVMTLQKPEPRPNNWITYILYGFETVFAPVQAALLALAIRRKFMR